MLNLNYTIIKNKYSTVDSYCLADYFNEVLLDFFGEFLIANPECLLDIIQSLFFLFIILLDTFFENNEEDNKNKGKGKATKEDEEEWAREAEVQSFGGNSNDSNSDNDNDNDKYNAKNAQIKFDEELAKRLEFDINNEEYLRNNSDSLSSYSVISSEFSENDDEYKANKKLDIQELEEKLRVEKIEQDKKNVSIKKRSLENDKDESSSMSKRSKKA